MKFSAAFLAVVLPLLAAQVNAAGAADTSLTIDPSVLAKGFENNGQKVQEPGQVPSLTSSNNFINFCIGKGAITNGLQVQGGSCNPAPMGQIPSVDKMPSSKFVFPLNMVNIPAKKAFTIQMKMSNLQTGSFTNAQQNYYAAPQQLNGQGLIIGHTHVVIEQISGLQQKDPTNPKVFAFFKGINTAANGQGIVSADVTAGLGDGVYRIASINAAMNHQPVLAPIAQHGSLDDMVYFSVGENGAKQLAATAGGVAAPAAAAAGAAAPAKAAAKPQVAAAVQKGAAKAKAAPAAAKAGAKKVVKTVKKAGGGKGGKGGKGKGKGKKRFARELDMAY